MLETREPEVKVEVEHSPTALQSVSDHRWGCFALTDRLLLHFAIISLVPTPRHHLKLRLRHPLTWPEGLA
jgi:hypothetical protein